LKLAIRNDLPAGFLATRATSIADLLPEPTLIHLGGARRPPLFVSLLLHGDENAGLVAVQEVLRRHADRKLPRALSIFVGNVSAARAGVRRLPEQRDFNRVWPGGDVSDGPEAAIMRDVVSAMRPMAPFASIDIHNNSGLNPHYACVNRVTPEFLQLAVLFSRTVVCFHEPRGVQSLAFADLCPAVAIECGRAGSAEGEAHAEAYLDAVLRLSELPRHVPAAHDLELFQTEAIVRVPPEISLSFDGSSADLALREDLDHLNFSQLAAGTELGRVADGTRVPLHVTAGPDGENRCQDFFEVRDRRLLLRRSSMPAMLTRSERAVRQDCLCYLMGRVP